MSLEVLRSSFGYSMLLHSRQKRNVICSWGAFWLREGLVVGGDLGERGAGEDILRELVCVLKFS